MEVVLVEPWFAGSHRAWAEGYAAASAHDVRIVSLPAGPWRWRLRAGAVPLARMITDDIELHGRPDALLVSGLVDVSSLRGLLAAAGLAVGPVVTFMHESQLLYPTTGGQPDPEACLRNWLTWFASDAVWFNSAFHRQAVLDELPRWQRSLPDREGLPSAAEVLAERSSVLPVGVDRPAGARRRSTGGPPRILWPHRWEADKAPAVFVRAIEGLIADGHQFELVLAGEDPMASPDRQRLLAVAGDRVVGAGPFDPAAYRQHLHDADIVVSCADHEFFGVAVVEAMRAGCLPLVPDGLSYPELVPDRYHDVALYPRGRFGSRLSDVVGRLPDLLPLIDGLAEALAPLSWSTVARRYDAALDDAVLAGAVAGLR